MIKLLLRALATWAIEAVAFLVLRWLLPGIRVDRWQSGVALVLAVGLLNASVRPLILLLAANLGLLLFALITLALNVLIVYLAAAFVPGFHIDNVVTALLFSFGLTLLNSLFTAMLSINDDDSYYRNVIRRIDRLRAPRGDLRQTGTVIIQIDGLAEPILRQELAAGRLPTLKGWLEAGSHRLVRWDCGVPSMTPGSQAGILHGNNANIPAFRWYEKDLKRLVVANHPKDAVWIDKRQATGHGLLRQNGASNSNIFSGEAERLVMTQAGLVDAEGNLKISPRDFLGYLINPYNLYRTFAGMIGEVVLEYWQAWRQRRKHVEPHMHRGGIYPLLRASSAILLRNIAEYLIVDDMFSGRLVSYSDFLGYDEVAHHSGPSSEDALGELRKLDRVFRSLAVAARRAPRRYQFVLLSDHGQSTGATFRQRHGYTLAELVDRLIAGEDSALMAGGTGEGYAMLSALLNQAASAPGLAGRGTRRMLGGEDGMVDLGPDAEMREAEAHGKTIVCASGNLALLYFSDKPGRLSLEAIEAAYPGLIEGLIQHEDIGFLLVLSQTRGALVLGKHGVRRLDDGTITGTDPLAGFEPSTADSLRRLSTFTNAGDIVINSSLDAESGQVAAFEELIGCHGGAGGLQTRPFLLFPSAWTADDPRIFGAEAMHDFLSRFVAGATPGA
ncbi:MAG TPA: phage holin family protein [Dehalococcoidia bacterium]|nr:phage holin family protein [Dehalococcoidia bacterium]